MRARFQSTIGGSVSIRLLFVMAIFPMTAGRGAEPTAAPERIVWRTPVSVAASGDGRWLATANRASGTVSLVDLTGERAGTLADEPADELAIGLRPGAIAARGEDGFVAVTTESGDLVTLAVKDGRLVETGRVHLGFEPHDVALSPDGATAWVPLAATAAVVAVDLDEAAILQFGRRRSGLAHQVGHDAYHQRQLTLFHGVANFHVISNLNSGWPVTPHPFLQAVSHGSLPPVNLRFSRPVSGTQC
jgi:hypothetical protein